MHIHYWVADTKVTLRAGKTAFLHYFHVSLLRDGHVVLLYMQSNPPLLFLHDKVYSRKSTSPPPETELYSLPTSENGFIWSLFDVDTSTQDIAYPPLLALCALCFPVQAPPPKANISWDWAEERFAYLGGLPLWTRQELYDAYVTFIGRERLLMHVHVHQIPSA